MPKTRTLEETFNRFADKRGPDECWPWTGKRNHKGYGDITRRVDGRTRYIKAARLAWSLANECPFPADKLACHSCDNPSCVNPAHIWPGTPLENMRDKIAKGRHVPPPGRQGRLRATCFAGHPFSPENTRIDSRGYRVCRTCARTTWREGYHRRKAAASEQAA